MYSCDGLDGVVCWEPRGGVEPAQRWDLAPTGLQCVSVDPAGWLLACAGGDGDVRILDTAEEQVRTSAGAQGRWQCVTLSLVSCSRIGCCMATRTACRLRQTMLIFWPIILFFYSLPQPLLFLRFLPIIPNYSTLYTIKTIIFCEKNQCFLLY